MRNKTPVILVIWVAFLFTQLLLVGVCWIVIPSLGPPGEPTGLEMVFPLIALMDCVMAVLLPRGLIAKASEALKPIPGRPAPTDAEVSSALTGALIIRFALFEFVTLLGLVHALTSRNPSTILPYAAAAVLGLLLSLPTVPRLRRLLGID